MANELNIFPEAIYDFDHGEIHEDPALKCYMHCIFKEVCSKIHFNLN